ncbi:MAG: [protein-PII] uridylyltransferase, partial [Planctomycetes bacterium]|nr:[protein-PII] uridylyltransferase [Planctomycetota bacterium]
QIAERGRQLLAGSATGIQAAAAVAESCDAFLLQLLEEHFQKLPDEQRQLMQRRTAVVALGGLGRHEMAPYSDVDLIFLYRPAVRGIFGDHVSVFVRDCWDAGMTLGHSIRTLGETLADARSDPHLATALVDARHLWGSESLTEELKRQFARRIVRSRRRAFIEECIASREQERQQHGATVQQLQPDVKRSLGGLRDLHLIRWIGFARFGTKDLSLLQQKGAFSRGEAQRLLEAAEFLLRVRFELHLGANKAQDVLTREEQMRIAEERGIVARPGQRPVERFMQEYFRHTMAVAECTRHFVELYRPVPARQRVRRFLTQRRAANGLLIGSTDIDLARPSRRREPFGLEEALDVYRLAALHRVQLSPRLERFIKSCAADWPDDASPAARKVFLEMLAVPGKLGTLLRSMYATGVLERVLPEIRHARCLLQFNQYHSYTVDEHTLRAIEEVERLGREDGPVGTAYRDIRHKEILHLALLLHDLGKGYQRDHCDVGRDLAEQAATRFGLSDQQRKRLVFLVHRHLAMAHLEFRRDTTESQVLLEFAREVGSPETLRMLFVLTAADFSAVGPGVWTRWKEDVLGGLYEKAMLILSGQHPQHLQQKLLAEVADQVKAAIVPLQAEDREGSERPSTEFIERQLQSFSPYYLTTTPPARIAADLDIIHRLRRGEIVVEGKYDPQTHTVDYRILMDGQYAEGCFHRIAGALTAKRLGIISAAINTTTQGIVVDVFRVVDKDFAGPCPESRIQEVAAAIRRVLTKEITVKELFQQHKRFAPEESAPPISDQPTKVGVDNDASDRCTVIDVFAHDRPGLLYTIARTIFRLGLSVELAKISTHFDQVVDVFYVTDARHGGKVQDEARLDTIRQELERRITEFEQTRHVEFV